MVIFIQKVCVDALVVLETKEVDRIEVPLVSKDSDNYHYNIWFPKLRKDKRLKKCCFALRNSLITFFNIFYDWYG